MTDLIIPSSLVSPEWLNENLNHPQLVILDAMLTKVGQKEYSHEALTLRLPSARDFDLKNVFKDLEAPLPNTMPSPAYFSEHIKKLGINQDDTIVIYDHHGVYSSPRAWWMFKVMGHKNVAVLNGGFPEWKKLNFPIENKKPYDGPIGNFEARFQSDLLIDANVLLENIDNPDFAILDARSNGRFTATEPEPRKNLRGGHIPNSKNLPIKEIVKDGKMLPPDALKEIYSELETDDKRLILSCGSGITACVIALGADQAGHENKAVFDGSWTEWAGNHKYPVE